MKYYIIAGEASGDLHASNLINALKRYDSNAEFRAWGGDRMEAAGARLVRHIRDISFMGFLEVAVNLRTILRNIRFCKKDIMEYQPDVLILVDYPGFNLRIAQYAKEHGLRVFYYISPQIWAWKQNRVKKIRARVDRMYVILPFEQAFYKSFGVEVDYEGHPLLDAIMQFREQQQLGLVPVIDTTDGRPLIALLPGSRRQEIQSMLRRMLSVVPAFPDCRFIIAASSNVPEDMIRALAADYPVEIVRDQTYAVLAAARAALVTSGTATLETALFGVPEVVCYKGSALSFAIAKRVVKIKYISLVNLILDRPAVTELIQADFQSERLIDELRKIMYDNTFRSHMLAQMQELQSRCGGSGASDRIARAMTARLNGQSA